MDDLILNNGKNQSTDRKTYAVSDQNGYYVFYTNDYSEAKQVMNEIDRDLDEDEGMAAIMKLVEGTDGYELYL